MSSLLLTGIIGETLVHHGHVRLLCGQNCAPCRQQLVAWGNPFNEALIKEHRRRKEVLQFCFCFCIWLSLLVSWSSSPAGCRDSPGSSWLAPPRTSPSTSCCHRSKRRPLRKAPRPLQEHPAAQMTHLIVFRNKTETQIRYYIRKYPINIYPISTTTVEALKLRTPASVSHFVSSLLDTVIRIWVYNNGITGNFICTVQDILTKWWEDEQNTELPAFVFGLF